MTRNPEIAAAQVRAAEVAAAAKKDVVRKVWMLPASTVLRVIEHQIARKLPSEVAAARELLEDALDQWERKKA